MFGVFGTAWAESKETISREEWLALPSRSADERIEAQQEKAFVLAKEHGGEFVKKFMFSMVTIFSL